MLYIKKYLIHPIKRRIAKYYLAFLKKFFGLKVIAITGSAGKTTTKEMLASILSRKGRVVASFANIDPVYNIPSTILKCTQSTKYLVLEMGVEFRGEMDFYLWLAKPDTGVITNIYPTHTLFFKDEKGVAKEKTKLLLSLGKDNFAVINSENRFLKEIKARIKAQIIEFGRSSDIKAKNVKFTKDFKTEFDLYIKNKKLKIRIPVIGLQFIENALAAASVAETLDCSLEDIKKGLEKYELSPHRMQIINLRSRGIIIDDSYNNNPEAAKRSLITFSKISKNRNKIIVFGDMLELGKDEIKYHKEIGKLISSIKPTFLICVGSLSKFTAQIAEKSISKSKVIFMKDKDQVSKIIKPFLDKKSIVLVKGSRSIGLDEVVSDIIKPI